MTHLLESYGLFLLFAAVGIESAGLPFVPGELALIAASVLAQQGRFSIVWVIVVAAVAATLGFGCGYWIGRAGGRRLLNRWNLTRRYAEKALPPAERFFSRHGTKTVFLARFVAVLRGTAALIAGITEMSWWEFLGWDIAGAVVWSIGYGLLAYYAGRAVVDAVSRYSAYGALGVIVAAALVYLLHRVVRRRLEGSG
ncbi:MAG TPA: DedA family protein [Gaiellaceae bacterium]|nr:DedA family protein [Gaiellaceae bacterium]